MTGHDGQGDSMARRIGGRWLAWTGVVFTACGALCTAGCGPDLTAVHPPNIEVRVDDKVLALKATPTASDCFLFEQDQTEGQQTYETLVKLKNTGTTDNNRAVKPLCLSSVVFQKVSDNTQLSMTVVSGKTTDEVNCKGGFAALAPNAVLTLKVTYTPKKDFPPDGTANIVISHNVTGKTTPAKFCFGVKSRAATIKLTPPEDTFTNASASNPPEHCYRFTNAGNAPLTYKGAKFETANGQYTITKQPNDGDQIPGNGEPGNLDGKAFLEVCVRYTPNGNPGDENVVLDILSNDATAPISTVTINADTKAGGYKISCNNAQNLQGFDFTGANIDKPQTCLIAAEGDAPFVIIATGDAQVEIVAEDPNLADAANAAYACHVELPVGNGVPGTVAVAGGKVAGLVCKYTPPSDGSGPPAAHVVVHYKQANVTNDLALPIVIGACESPTLVLGPDPSSSLWFLAETGKTASNVAVVANQSCAPLQLVQACVTAANLSSENACDNSNAASQDFTVSLLTSSGQTAPFSLMSLPKWGLQALQIDFKPAIAKQSYQSLLHLRYCSGKWESNNCTGGTLVHTTLSLVGVNDATLKQPKLTLAVNGPIALGKAVTIEGKVTDNAWPAHNFQWFVRERPTDASGWLYGVSTNDPLLGSFVPDHKGKYVIVGQAQTYDDSDPSKMAWTPQATVELTVP
jgi:hypothetical protein